MGGNELTAVPQKALAILDTLKKLEIQENRIRKIREGDFMGLKNLDSLILAHNMLTEVPANVFSHLTLLNSLELEGNQLTHIDKDAFSGLEGKIYNCITNLPHQIIQREFLYNKLTIFESIMQKCHCHIHHQQHNLYIS